ncbi:MAG: putative toxin-antitoxin system toxin component, PIN family [Brachymonas sp.]|nr:putative toxin-antitoxin system toxin component, PIN family [Brachymonas sp.]
MSLLEAPACADNGNGTPLAPVANDAVVIDTNIALDLLLFHNPEVDVLRVRIESGTLRWLATARMGEELQRVLHYPHIAARLQDDADAHRRQLLAQRDAWVHLQADAPRSIYVCKDADDQCFIDLAVAHSALLLSKDAQVLKLRKRLAKLGVVVSRQLA